MGSAIGQQLKVVDLENNEIAFAALGSGYDNTPMWDNIILTFFYAKKQLSIFLSN